MKILVVSVLIALPLLAGCSTARPGAYASVRCPVRMATSPSPAGEGIVVRLLSQPEAMALLSRTQVIVGRPIDGAYINNVRAIVKTPDGEPKTVLIPYSMTVNIGDRLAFQSAYLSMPPLCNYVPTSATRKL